MSQYQPLTTQTIRAIFDEEITAAGGTVAEVFDDGTRLFTRSILAWSSEVSPKDLVRGGVALRATECTAWVHPYVFRQVCRNGAIRAHAIQTREIRGLDTLPFYDGVTMLREAVRACSAEDVFTTGVGEARSAREVEADLELNAPLMFSALAAHFGDRVRDEIMKRFFRGADLTRFGLMNALTSVARDTSDPERRWRLEEFGGGIPVARLPAPELPGDRAHAVRRSPQRIA